MKKRDEIIWNNVLFLAAQKGWNKTELAKKVGTNTSVLNNIKDGTRGIGNRLLAKFAVALGVSESDLLKDSYYNPIEKTTPATTSQEIPWSLQTIIDSIRDDVKAINSRMDAQGNALQGLQDDCLEVKNEIHEIYKRMYEAAESKDVRKLKKVG